MRVLLISLVTAIIILSTLITTPAWSMATTQKTCDCDLSDLYRLPPSELRNMLIAQRVYDCAYWKFLDNLPAGEVRDMLCAQRIYETGQN
jgi:hypothetical protein